MTEKLIDIDSNFLSYPAPLFLFQFHPKCNHTICLWYWLPPGNFTEIRSIFVRSKRNWHGLEDGTETATDKTKTMLCVQHRLWTHRNEINRLLLTITKQYKSRTSTLMEWVELTLNIWNIVISLYSKLLLYRDVNEWLGNKGKSLLGSSIQWVKLSNRTEHLFLANLFTSGKKDTRNHLLNRLSASSTSLLYWSFY